MESEEVAKLLVTKGYKKVYRYVEGLKDWVAAGLPTEGESPNEPVPPRKPAPQPQS